MSERIIFKEFSRVLRAQIFSQVWQDTYCSMESLHCGKIWTRLEASREIDILCTCTHASAKTRSINCGNIHRLASLVYLAARHAKNNNLRFLPPPHQLGELKLSALDMSQSTLSSQSFRHVCDSLNACQREKNRRLNEDRQSVFNA